MVALRHRVAIEGGAALLRGPLHRQLVHAALERVRRAEPRSELRRGAGGKGQGRRRADRDR